MDSQASVISLQKVTGEGEDIIGAFTQRRNDQGVYAEAVVEVRPEPAFRNFFTALAASAETVEVNMTVKETASSSTTAALPSACGPTAAQFQDHWCG